MSTTDIDSDTDARLCRLFAAGRIDALDLEFARMIGRQCRSTRWDWLLAAALASHAPALGHVCEPLAGPRRLLLGADERGEALWTPQAAGWLQRLRDCPALGRPGELKPLLLDASGRLYLYRYWLAERTLAERLLALAAQPVAVDEARLAADLATLFPGAAADDGQLRAAATAALSALALITGGPGTGKTTTLASVLAALLRQGEPPPRIALAAPTGKAAARMGEALDQRRPAIAAAFGADFAAQLPTTAMTLHRLLGLRPDGSARHDAATPLDCDVLVIDEASMVDLTLMSRTLAALPPRARLILLGDRHQLASVDAGAVLGDLGAQAGPPSPAFAERLRRVTGAAPTAAEAGSALRDGIAELSVSHRFGADSGIGRLARAINAGDADAALASLEAGLDDLAWQPAAGSEAAVARALAGYEAYLQALAAGADAPALAAAFAGFRLLAATRHGPLGVETLNARIEARIRQRLRCGEVLWYPGRAVMVTRNDYTLGLFNGDVGIAVGSEQGLRVAFVGADGHCRTLPVPRLPEHEPVFAMTVHKAQGSEFECVLLVLAASEQATSRELFYTGVTRARRQLELLAEREALQQAVQTVKPRASGLADRLAGQWD